MDTDLSMGDERTHEAELKIRGLYWGQTAGLPPADPPASLGCSCCRSVLPILMGANACEPHSF